jgi:hypothetical protein
MQTQENDMLTSALNESNISTSTVDQTININFKLKNNNSSSKKNNIISSHRDSTSQVEHYKATVSSSSQQMKIQQNMMIFNLLITENLTKKSNHVQSYKNLNDTEDNKQNVKKHYTK